MTVEDFSQAYWVEKDDNNHIAVVGTNHVDFQDYRNEDCYFKRDMGAGHFTDFKHKIDVKAVSGQNYRQANVWMLSNEVDDAKGLYDASKTYIDVEIYKTGDGIEGIYLSEIYNHVYYSTSPYTITDGTMYYLTVQKTGTALTCEVYSNSARTTLLATLSLTLHANHNFRYIFVCNTWNSGHNFYGDCDIENLDLKEFIAHSITVTEYLGGLDSYSRTKAINRTITELLGTLDTKLLGGFRVKEVVVGEEDLSVDEGYENDEVTYTATVLDSDANVLPEDFMVDLIAVATAKFGKTNIGEHPLNYGNTIEGCPFELEINGYVTDIMVYLCRGGSAPTGVKTKCAIYDMDGNLMGQTEEIAITNTSPDWIQFDFASAIYLLAGDYILTIWNEYVSAGETKYNTYYFDWGGPIYTKSLTYTGDYPDPLEDCGYNENDATFSIYAEYTAESVTVLIDDQLLTSDVYDQETGELALVFIVPHEHGNYIIELDWEDQTFYPESMSRLASAKKKKTGILQQILLLLKKRFK